MSKRRASGDGSVYQLANGTWRGVVDLGWHQGRRRRKYLRGATKAEVVKLTRRMAQEAEHGRLSPQRPPTMAAWMERYLSEVAATTVRPSTLQRYRQEVRLYIVPALGRIRIDQLRPADVSRFYQDQLQRLSPGSVRRLHALLRRSLSVAVRWQLVDRNPVLAVDPPSLDTKEIQPLSAEDTHRFLGAVRGDRLEARWMLGLVVGLRQGEALGLSWQDVDLDNGSLQVRQALQYRSGERLQLVQPKTYRSRRTVPRPESIIKALALRRKHQDADREAAGEFWEDWGLVFTTKLGTPFSPRNDYRSFQLILDRADLPRIRLHDLRHTAASLMLAEGVQARVIMQTLGHSQISITLNTYGHVSPGLSRDAADRMESLMARADEALAAKMAADEAEMSSSCQLLADDHAAD